MNRSLTLFLGIFLTFTSSWLGLVWAPFVQLNDTRPSAIEGTNTSYPVPPQGEVLAGRRVYQANGCIYCHSQQITRQGYRADIERGWGQRRTVARDYIYDRPHLLGTMRTGPDLANIAQRQPSFIWHHQHLYYPRLASPGSIMPPFDFLYAKRKIGGPPRTDEDRARLESQGQIVSLPLKPTEAQMMESLGLNREGFRSLPEDQQRARARAAIAALHPLSYVEPGFEVVPTAGAKALVAYLLSLNHSEPLPEAEP